MAWNKPNSNTVGTTSSSRSSGRGKTPRLRRGLIAGVIVVLGAGLAVWLLSNGEATSSSLQKKDRGLIKEVTPAAAPKAEQLPEQNPLPKVVTNYNEKGVWYDDRGRPHYKPVRVVYSGSNTVINGKRWVPPRSIFKHASESEIDRVLSMQPGERILGETNWKFFEKDLREALIEPIRIDPEDTPEEIKRKEAVKAAKKELAAAIGAGESPSKILKEAQEQANKLADLYDNLNRELYEARTSGEMSEAEFEDYVAAANKMLESNNILTKRFRTPAEIREKAAAAKQRKLLKQQQNQ